MWTPSWGSYPLSANDHCDPLIPHDVPLPLTPASSACETHHDYGHPLPPTIPPVTSPFSIPWIVSEHGGSIDLTTTQPAIDVEKTTMSFSPDTQHYWFRIIDMEPIKASQKATQMIRDTYIDKIVYLESVEPLEQNEMLLATWAALITWHKTGKISGVSIGRAPLRMRNIEHRDPPRFGLRMMFNTMRQRLYNLSHILNSVAHLSGPQIGTTNGLPFPPTPSRPIITFEKRDMHRGWIRIIDMEPIEASSIITAGYAERATQSIKDTYIGKIVYLEWAEPLQNRGTMHAIWTALMIWHKTGYKSGLGLRIGRTPIDMEAIEPKPLYERPFTLAEIPRYRVAGASLSLIPTEELVLQRRMVLADGSMSENVEVVTMRNGILDIPLRKWMIHKKMTPETSPADMIVEADTYLTLRGCKHAPKLLGVTGNPATGECRGLLIEYILGRSLCPIPLMYTNMRLEVTMNLVKAMVEFEERGIYLQDPNPNNVILTVDDGLYIIDFGPSYTEDFYPEDRLHDIFGGKIEIGTAMYLLLMLLRFIWNEGMVGSDRKPVAPTKLRNLCPARLLSMLDNPDAVEYSSFRELLEVLQQERV